MSFEGNPEANIIGYGRSALRHHYLQNVFPTKYELHREIYTLTIELNTKSYLPAVTIYASTADGGRSSVYFLPSDGVALCSAYREVPTAHGITIHYTWLGADMMNDDDSCKQEIRLRIAAPEGQTLGVELLDYELKENGLYLVLDSV